MECNNKGCNNCTYDDEMINLCLDKETRNMLLDLIKDTINQEFSTYEFLFDKDIESDLKQFICNATRTAMDCILPDKESTNV